MSDLSRYVARAEGAFRFLDLGRLREDPPSPPAWVWDGFVERGEVVWVAGPGKAGKSMTVLGLAAALQGDVGGFLGRPTAVGHQVVVVDCENSVRTVADRLGRIGGSPPGGYVLARGADLAGRDGLETFDRICADRADRPNGVVVILDSLIGLHRVDEDNAGEVRWFVSGLREVAEFHGATIIGLAHENRSGNLRGSLDWRNAADTVLELRRDDHGWRTLRVADRRNGEEGLAVTFRFGGGPSGLLEFATTGGPNRGPTALEVMAGQVLQVLSEDPQISQTDAARALGTTRDSGTFRRGWAMARATMESGPGQAGHPPIGVARVAHPHEMARNGVVGS